MLIPFRSRALKLANTLLRVRNQVERSSDPLAWPLDRNYFIVNPNLNFPFPRLFSFPPPTQSSLGFTIPLKPTFVSFATHHLKICLPLSHFQSRVLFSKTPQSICHTPPSRLTLSKHTQMLSQYVNSIHISSWRFKSKRNKPSSKSKRSNCGHPAVQHPLCNDYRHGCCQT